jgi:hypothetical protein
MRVSGFLAEAIQHIHSLRASGVMSFQVPNILGEDKRSFFRSGGVLWIGEVDIGDMGIFYHNRKRVLPNNKAP